MAGGQKSRTPPQPSRKPWIGLKTMNTSCRIYAVGMGPRSVQAIDNIKRICEEYLPSRYRLEIIDIYQQPIFARDDQIVAASTLIKKVPPTPRKLTGNTSNFKA